MVKKRQAAQTTRDPLRRSEMVRDGVDLQTATRRRYTSDLTSRMPKSVLFRGALKRPSQPTAGVLPRQPSGPPSVGAWGCLTRGYLRRFGECMT